MTVLTLYLATLLFFTPLALTNVEKVVFLGPEAKDSSPAFPSFGFPLFIDTLSPARPSLRRQLHSKFPHSAPLQEPSEVWFLLLELQASKRYEVRICWPATVSCNVRDLIPLSMAQASHSNQLPSILYCIRHLMLLNLQISPTLSAIILNYKRHTGLCN